MKSALVVMAITMAVCACHSHPVATQNQTDDQAWPQHMQGLAQAVYRLVPFIYSERAYENPGNSSEIENDLKKFSSIAHDITPKMGEQIVGTDPMVQYSLAQLKVDVLRAQNAFSNGSLDYSRGVMKNVMNHCFNCHSFNDAGSKATWDISAFRSLNLSALEKVDLLMASRQFANAKEVLENLLKDPDYMQNSPLDFEMALRRYLSLSVRAKLNPKETLQVLEQLNSRDNIPFYVQDHLRVWQQSLRNWAHEKPSHSNLLEQAKLRMKVAEGLQAFAKDHSGDIEYLRVTSLLHDFLKTKQSNEKQAQAFLMLGQSYEVLDVLGYWNLQDVYYEACIRTAPKSTTAPMCFRRLRSSIYFSFSGSSGLHVPESERQRLNELKSLL